MVLERARRTDDKVLLLEYFEVSKSVWEWANTKCLIDAGLGVGSQPGTDDVFRLWGIPTIPRHSAASCDGTEK